jgi:hypothetical protein
MADILSLSPGPPRANRAWPLAWHISRLVGHSGTMTTETIYRKQIRPILIQGATPWI